MRRTSCYEESDLIAIRWRIEDAEEKLNSDSMSERIRAAQDLFSRYLPTYKRLTADDNPLDIDYESIERKAIDILKKAKIHHKSLA